MKTWAGIRPNLPILITPMDSSGENHNSYGDDGIRITGTWAFISSILSRLKDVMYHENPNTRLRLVLRGIDSSRDARPDRNSYVFYLNLQKRGQRKQTI